MQVVDEVCGSDGVIYFNECVMRVSSCRSQKLIHVVSRSHCAGLSHLQSHQTLLVSHRRSSMRTDEQQCL